MQWFFDIVIAMMEDAGFIRMSDVTALNHITWPQAKAHVEAGDLDFIKLTDGEWIGPTAAQNLMFLRVVPRDVTRLNALDFTIDTLRRLGVGTQTPAHPLHIVAAEVTDFMAFLLETTSAHHCYFGFRSPAVNRNVGFFIKELTTNRFLIDYVTGEDLYRFHNYTYGARMLELLDNGDVQLPSSYGNTVGGTNHALYIDNAGKVGQQPSSESVKTNVRDLDKSDDIHQLHCARFDCAQGGRQDQPGLIAEQVEEVMPELVDYKRVPVYGDVADPVSGDIIRGITHYETTDQPETVRYEDLIPHLLKEIQTLRKDLDELKAEVRGYHP